MCRVLLFWMIWTLFSIPAKMAANPRHGMVSIVRKGFYAVAFVTDNPKLAFLSEPNSQGVVVWWFFKLSLDARLIEAYEKRDHVDPV